MKNNLKKILCTVLTCSTVFFLHAQTETQKELTVVMQRGNLDLNPHTSAYTDEAQILNSLYEGLFTYNPVTSDPENALVESYTTSRDMLVYNFKLKENSFFSNGNKITADDIKNSWLALLRTPGAYYASFLDIVKGAKAYRHGKGNAEDVAISTKGEYILRVELESPASHFPKILCLHAFAAVDLKDGSFSGPYVIENISPEKIVLTKNEYYRENCLLNIPKVNILFSSDKDENAVLFNSGAAQWIMADCEVKAILDKESVLFEPLFGTYYFFFKLNNKNLTEKVRLALLEATPWEELRKGSLCPASTLIYPLPGYSRPAPLNYTDPDHARTIISEAKKELGLKEEDIIELTFEIPEGDSIYEAATILKYAWGEIGVRLNIKVNPNPAYISEISKLDSDLFIYTWIGDFSDPAAFLELFRSDSSLNETHWSNKDFDALLDKANRTKKNSDRLEILSEAEDILLSSGVIIPLTHSIDLNVVNKNEIGGYFTNALGLHPFKHMYFNQPKSQFEYGKVAKF